MKINDRLILEIEFKNIPDDKDLKRHPEAIKKIDYDNYRESKDVNVSIINDEKDLFNNPKRVDIIANLPKWFNFDKFRIYIITLNEIENE